VVGYGHGGCRDDQRSRRRSHDGGGETSHRWRRDQRQAHRGDDRLHRHLRPRRGLRRADHRRRRSVTRPRAPPLRQQAVPRARGVRTTRGRDAISLRRRRSRRRSRTQSEALRTAIRNEFEDALASPARAHAWFGFWQAAMGDPELRKANERLYTEERERFSSLFDATARQRGLHIDHREAGIGLVALVDGAWNELVMESDFGPRRCLRALRPLHRHGPAAGPGRSGAFIRQVVRGVVSPGS
jgi:hypothetical protein